jgi:geranylgeranyl pyrophosphate synthase
LTLPLVVAVERVPELLPLVRRIHAGDVDAVEGVREAVVSSGACDEVRFRADRVTKDALRELAGLRASPARIMLETIATEMVARAR